MGEEKERYPKWEEGQKGKEKRGYKRIEEKPKDGDKVKVS